MKDFPSSWPTSRICNRLQVIWMHELQKCDGALCCSRSQTPSDQMAVYNLIWKKLEKLRCKFCRSDCSLAFASVISSSFLVYSFSFPKCVRIAEYSPVLGNACPLKLMTAICTPVTVLIIEVHLLTPKISLFLYYYRTHTHNFFLWVNKGKCSFSVRSLVTVYAV